MLELRSYQKAGVAHLKQYQTVLLGDEMGLGKTAQALVAAKELGTEHILVLCPGYARRNWLKECGLWWPEASVAIIDAIPMAVEALLEPSVNVVLMSHQLLPLAANFFRKEVERYESRPRVVEVLIRAGFRRMHFDAIIADESAQHLSNRKSQKSQLIHLLRAPYRWALTGTPMRKGVPDLWSQLRFVEPRVFTSYWRFVETYCNVGFDEWGHRLILGEKPGLSVVDTLGPMFLRRLAKDYLPELPPLIFEPLYVELSPEEEANYRQMEQLMATVIEDKLVSASVVIAQMQKLQRMAIGLQVLNPEARARSTKLQALAGLCKDHLANGESVLVFSKWTESTYLAQQYLQEEKLPTHVITGEEADRRRVSAEEDFMTGGPSVLLATIGAAGTALNLQRATVVVFLDLSYVPSENEQGWKRAHRPGVSGPVTIVPLIAEGTIDEDVMEVNRLRAQGIAVAQGDPLQEVVELFRRRMKE